MYKDLMVLLDMGKICFKGKYRRDLEAPNWHYYETEDGNIFHFKKSHMVAVFENLSQTRASKEFYYGNYQQTTL